MVARFTDLYVLHGLNELTHCDLVTPWSSRDPNFVVIVGSGGCYSWLKNQE